MRISAGVYRQIPPVLTLPLFFIRRPGQDFRGPETGRAVVFAGWIACWNCLYLWMDSMLEPPPLCIERKNLV